MFGCKIKYSSSHVLDFEEQISLYVPFLGACAKKLWDETISFVMSVRLSARPPARPHEKTLLPLDELSWNFISEYFSVIFREIQVPLKCHNNPSACPSAWNNSAPARQILMRFDIWLIFWKPAQKLQVSLNSHKNNEFFTCRLMYVYNTSLKSS
jgi:hypothetical protein